MISSDLCFGFIVVIKHATNYHVYNVTLFASDCALLLFLTLFICVERRCIDYHTMACD